MSVLRRASVCAISAMLMLVSASAHAQYFGRNKVEYTDFDFRILTTAHFDVYYYSREERAARIAAQLAERWYSRISRVLHHQLERRQPLVVYGSQAEFAQTNVVSGMLPDTVGGVTESSRRRIVMPFAPTMAETDRVLGHEIVHAFQFDIARRYGGGLGQPLWFVEGMAEYSRADPQMPRLDCGFATQCVASGCLVAIAMPFESCHPINTAMPSGRTSASGLAMRSSRRR